MQVEGIYHELNDISLMLFERRHGKKYKLRQNGLVHWTVDTHRHTHTHWVTTQNLQLNDFSVTKIDRIRNRLKYL